MTRTRRSASTGLRSNCLSPSSFTLIWMATQKMYHCLPDPTRSSTTEYQRHTSSGFFYIVDSTVDGYTIRIFLYRGPNVIETFFERVTDEYNSINHTLATVVPMQLAPEEIEHEQANECFIYGQHFCGERPVCDHDHLLRKYRGVAHTDCNFEFK